MSRRYIDPGTRWRNANMHRLSPEERQWFEAIRSIGFQQREAFDLALIAVRRQLYQASLTKIKEHSRGMDIFRAVREWIRGL